MDIFDFLAGPVIILALAGFITAHQTRRRVDVLEEELSRLRNTPSDSG